MTGLATAFGYPYNSQYLLNGHSCCENTTSPAVAANAPHVCSCQLEQAIHHKMRSTMPIGLLPSPGYSTQPTGVMFGDPATIYPSLMRQYDVKEMTSNTAAFNPAWFGLNARFDAHNFERNAYLAFNRFGERFSPIDLNSGARRKNATKETTSTLKAWLYEHRKNPYPTKGEKIMLAILTKMTLTQVSTWFANARRRLKKENKMTWSPRNRCGDKKEGGEYSEDEEDDDDEEGEEDENNEESERNNEKNILKQSDQSIARTTTVIKSVEGARNEKISTIPDHQLERNLVWQRSVVEETRSKNEKMECNLEDSPVKSLRRWVDGCFDHGSPTLPPQTPPRTPTSDVTEPITEQDGTQHSPCQPPVLKYQSHRRSITREHQDVVGETSERCSQNESVKEDGTSNREIDAALVLTTLFSRN